MSWAHILAFFVLAFVNSLHVVGHTHSDFVGTSVACKYVLGSTAGGRWKQRVSPRETAESSMTLFTVYSLDEICVAHNMLKTTEGHGSHCKQIYMIYLLFDEADEEGAPAPFPSPPKDPRLTKKDADQTKT